MFLQITDPQGALRHIVYEILFPDHLLVHVVKHPLPLFLVVGVLAFGEDVAVLRVFVPHAVLVVADVFPLIVHLAGLFPVHGAKTVQLAVFVVVLVLFVSVFEPAFPKPIHHGILECSLVFDFTIVKIGNPFAVLFIVFECALALQFAVLKPRFP